MKTLDDLEELLAAATPGEAITEGQMVVLKDTLAYVVCDCTDELKTVEQEVADAHRIAATHNALPALIECARALEFILRFYVPDDAKHTVVENARAALTTLDKRTLSGPNDGGKWDE